MEHNKYEHRVLPQETDFSGCMTLTALGALFLNTAGEDAVPNHFGPDDLLKVGCGWVVSRLAIEMTEYPKMYDYLQVETWVEDFDVMFTTRNFRLYNADGTVIGMAGTQWAVIGLNTRRPVNLQQFKEWQAFATGEASGMEKPRRVGDMECEPASSHRVRYSDLDFNKHTNSMKYAEWMLDALPLEQFEGQRVKRFDINYLREARFGKSVDIYLNNSRNLSHFEIRDDASKPLCKAEMEWV